MKSNFGTLMKQAQAMQASLEKAQAEIASLEVTGESGGGMVRIVMTGRHDVRRVQIDPLLMGDEREMLEDLIAAAMNDAVQKVETVTKEKMSGLTSGLSLPPGFKLPF